MPKIVDHERRRRDLARATIRVIGRDGLDKASFRAIATEAGWSTGVLQHYFATKADLLDAALDEIEVLILEPFVAAQSAPSGRAAIVASIDAMLAVDDDAARVWLAFAAQAATDPVAARRWRRAERLWRDRWSSLVRRGIDDGSLDRDVDPAAAGAMLHSLISGARIGTLLGSPVDATLAIAGLAPAPTSRR